MPGPTENVLHIRDIITLKDPVSHNNVIYLSEHQRYSDFENLYLKVRKREGRIYPDSIVDKLPLINPGQPEYREWIMRGNSFNKLKSYILADLKPLNILDLGCGNGWLSNQLAQVPQSHVFGLDLNRVELEQAARVFSKTPSLHFIYGNIFEEIFIPESFDQILLASAVQYFSELRALLDLVSELLRQNGKIHVLDTPFYTEDSAPAAKRRTIDYYKNLGYEEMVNYYHHHMWSELKGYNYKIMYNPGSYFNWVRRKIFRRPISPFPWIVIQP